MTRAGRLHLTEHALQRFRGSYGAGPRLRRRACGWAALYASLMLLLDEDHPLRGCGEQALTTLRCDPSGGVPRPGDAPW